MKFIEYLVLLFAVLIIVASAVLIYSTLASCSERGCYGGMCMTSAACAPGCACISGRCS
jgi:hypothetical protein